MGRPPRWWLVALALLVLVTLSRSAQAQNISPIAVEREAGAEDCPDGAALTAAVTTLIGDAKPGQTPAYAVSFGRTAQAFTAVIRSSAVEGVVRQLEAQEPNCAGLAHATAVTLALLLDAELGRAPEPPPPAAPPPAKPAAKPPAPPSPRPAKTELEPMFSLGAAALVGVLRPIAPALVADVGLGLESWRAELGALWAPPRSLELGPGRVRQQLLSAQLRACYAAYRGRVLRLELCSGALLGAVTAEARGFSRSEQRSRSFLALPAELTVSARRRGVGFQLGAAALLLLPPNEFTVAGVGSAYRPARVAGLFTLSVFFEPFR
jgi:hypothetical protein